MLLQRVRQRLAREAVRVIVVDPFENNERARQLVSKSARYRSGYWVVKMFVWRFEEYTKMVYGEGDGLRFILFSLFVFTRLMSCSVREKWRPVNSANT